MAIDISQRIRRKYSTFSKGQKKIATAILQDYDKVAFMTAARLGRLVGVSESTVVRFAGELGFEGYAEFQRAVQELMRIKLTPNQRIAVTKNRVGRLDMIDCVMEADIRKIRYTLKHLNREHFHGAVMNIINARNIYIMGARSSEALAYFLKYNLTLIFDNVKYVQPTSSAEMFEQLLAIGEQDVLIAFSFPRYFNKMISAVKFARQNGAKVIVITDSDVSPLAEHASFLLTAQSDMASFCDSLVAPFSILNALIAEIAQQIEGRITRRFEKLEKVWDEYNVYSKR